MNDSFCYSCFKVTHIMINAGVCSLGWVLHVYSADANRCAGLGLNPQPAAGVHTTL